MTLTPKALRRMQYITDQAGIYRRYLREQKNWDMHLTNTKNFIKYLVDKKQPKQVVILGSGWLLDVPIHYLSENCKDVHLVDVHHPSTIRRDLARFNHVHFHSHDLSGCINQVMEYTAPFWPLKKPWPTLKPEINFNLEADLWISVNVLDQLDAIVIDYLKPRTKYNKAQIKNARQTIQDAHLQFLDKKNAAIIYSKSERHYHLNTKKLSDEKDLYFARKNPTGKQQWEWIFDTKGLYTEKNSTVFDVVAAII